MAKSINRLLAELITATGDVDNSALGSVNLLDSADVLSIGNSSASGTAVFDTLDSLPTSNLSSGQQAFVNANQRLYISNGSGWYNLTFVNRTPTWLTEPDASYDIVDSATPLLITAKAIDSDNSDVNLLNQSVVSDSAQYMVNISNDSSVWTFTPKSADSIGIEVAAGNLTDSNGDFVYTFKWSDGINFVSKAVTIGYSPSGGGSNLVCDRGFRVGNTTYPYTQIDYWDMTVAGNAADFGDLAVAPTEAKYQPICSDKTYIYQIHENSNIQYWTSATLGNATNGYAATLRTAPMNGSAQTNGSRGIHYHGYHSGYSGYSPYVDYFPVGGVSGATCTNFGTFQTLQDHRMVGNATRFVINGGQSANSYSWSNMQYGDYDTTANTQSFGSLAYGRSQHAAMGTGSGAAADIAMVAGGTQTGSNVRTQIEYHNVATLGNGTLAGTGQGIRHMDGCNNAGKAHHAGGINSSNTSGNWIYEMDMSTTASASYFGALTSNVHFLRCSSGAAA